MVSQAPTSSKPGQSRTHKEDLTPSVLTDTARLARVGQCRPATVPEPSDERRRPRWSGDSRRVATHGYNVEWPPPSLLETSRLELLNLSFAELPGSGCREGVLDPPRALGLALRQGRWGPLVPGEAG